MNYMIALRHMRAYRVRALLALLAISLFVTAPLLLEHHHHSNLTQNAHCAVCTFASAQVTPASPPFVLARNVASTPCPRTPDETLVSGLRIYTRNERAPPAA